jgi:hypothetical protein
MVSVHSLIKNTIRSRIPTTFPFVLLLFWVGCSSSHLLESRWSEGRTAIDGIGAGWRDSLVTLDDKKTSIGLINDNDYLYVSLVTTNRDLERQIVRRGLTFWFDRDGGEKKQFGVRFPLGIEPFGRFRNSRREEHGGQTRQHGDSIFVPVNHLEVLGEGTGQQHRLTFAEATGIDARFHTTADTLTYTLKVPISTSGYFPYTIGARPGTIVGVTLETAAGAGLERPPDESGEGGRGEGGFGGGGKYGGRGGFSGGRFRPGGGTMKPFSQFVKIHLAARSSDTH